MEKMNKDELRTPLIEEKLIDETGTVNATTVNYISGLYTLPFLSEVWDLYLHDADAMAELQVFARMAQDDEKMIRKIQKQLSDSTASDYKDKMDLDIQVARLKLLKASHLSQRYATEDSLHKYFPSQIMQSEERIRGYE